MIYVRIYVSFGVYHGLELDQNCIASYAYELDVSNANTITCMCELL